jgi:large subunit ribosomal protein L24
VAPRLKKDDLVYVRAGKDRGKTGKVLRLDPKAGRVWIEGLNMVKRHQSPTDVRGSTRGAQVGGVIEKEGPIHVSNVMLVDPQDNKPTRVAIVREGGRRMRIAKRTGNRID